MKTKSFNFVERITIITTVFLSTCIPVFSQTNVEKPPVQEVVDTASILAMIDSLTLEYEKQKTRAIDSANKYGYLLF